MASLRPSFNDSEKQSMGIFGLFLDRGITQLYSSRKLDAHGRPIASAKSMEDANPPVTFTPTQNRHTTLSLTLLGHRQNGLADMPSA